MWIFESRGKCWKCHNGDTFSDHEFHNTGVGFELESRDLGRFEHTQKEEDPEDDEVSLELKIAENIVEPFVAMLQRIESSQDRQLVGQPQHKTGKEIRYRDLSW